MAMKHLFALACLLALAIAAQAEKEYPPEKSAPVDTCTGYGCKINKCYGGGYCKRHFKHFLFKKLHHPHIFKKSYWPKKAYYGYGKVQKTDPDYPDETKIDYDYDYDYGNGGYGYGGYKTPVLKFFKHRFHKFRGYGY